jgi:hypothetical protein
MEDSKSFLPIIVEGGSILPPPFRGWQISDHSSLSMADGKSLTLPKDVADL